LWRFFDKEKFEVCVLHINFIDINGKESFEQYLSGNGQKSVGLTKAHA
jgi:hypothetical protein